MDAKKNYRDKDVKRLSRVLNVNEDEAFRTWDTFSSRIGGAGWIELPKENKDILIWLKETKFDEE